MFKLVLFTLMFSLFFGYSNAKVNCFEGKINQLSCDDIVQQANEHSELVNKFYNLDSLNIQEKTLLLYGIAVQFYYDPLMNLNLETAILLHNDSMRNKEAKLLCDTLLEKNPVSLIGHEEMSFVMGRLGNPGKAKYHKQLYLSLLDIILQSGDGLSKNTAYITTSFKDMYVVCEVKGYLVVGSKKVVKNGQKYTVVTAYKDFKKQKFWFNDTLIERYG